MRIKGIEEIPEIERIVRSFPQFYGKIGRVCSIFYFSQKSRKNLLTFSIK